MPLLGQVEVCKKSHCQDMCQVTLFFDGFCKVLKQSFLEFCMFLLCFGRTNVAAAWRR